MSRFTNSGYEVEKAMNHGVWVRHHTPFGTNADLLVQGRYEIFDDWPKKGRPMLAAVHRDDMTGGFEKGMRVKLSPNATHIGHVAMNEVVRRHAAAGKAGVVESVADAETLMVSVVFDDVVDDSGQGYPMLVPGDWLSRE